MGIYWSPEPSIIHGFYTRKLDIGLQRSYLPLDQLELKPFTDFQK